ncbi:SprT-like zinc ribbon domain, partial [Pristimantis euphronides]
MEITWSKKLKTTAGKCRYWIDGNDSRICTIVLSENVCNSPERLRDTLIHELCHAACWILDGVEDAGHGPFWKLYTEHAAMVHPDLPEITRCHSYDIHYKYIYECDGCEKMTGRFRILPPNKAICRACK